MSELKKCPFCGNAQIISNKDKSKACWNCGSTGPSIVARPIDWNTRDEETKLRAEVERLGTMIKKWNEANDLMSVGCGVCDHGNIGDCVCRENINRLTDAETALKEQKRGQG